MGFNSGFKGLMLGFEFVRYVCGEKLKYVGFCRCALCSDIYTVPAKTCTFKGT